jgi:hypothetical protein
MARSQPALMWLVPLRLAFQTIALQRAASMWTQKQIAPARMRFALAAQSMIARQQLALMYLAHSRRALLTIRSLRAASLRAPLRMQFARARMEFALRLVRRRRAPMRTLFARLQAALMRLPLQMQFVLVGRPERF